MHIILSPSAPHWNEFSGYYAFGGLRAGDCSVVSFKSGENMLKGYILGEENHKGLVVLAHATAILNSITRSASPMGSTKPSSR